MLMHGASAGGVERGGYRQRWSPRNGIRCLRGRGGGRRIDYTNRPPLPQSGFFRAGSCKKCDGRLKAGVFLLRSGEGPRRGGGGGCSIENAGRPYPHPNPSPAEEGLWDPFFTGCYSHVDSMKEIHQWRATTSRTCWR
ncbi:hypothetical protein XACJJ10_140010 [Xanthomonas citri pv. citri]|nr:hypothetical protein XACJJ10_140010 [Xanthomonas citri pv. citri]